jgi:ubiquinone/menaquinone biosynthesis C-methylase UbiE
VDESLTKTYSHDTNLNGQKGEKIEILSVALLERNRELVASLKRLARSLHLEFGWHYLLDLTWIIENLGEIDGKKIMDAGAGVGIIQWYLAQQGAEIISVDRSNRSELSMKLRSRYHVQGLRGSDLIPTRSMFKKNFSREIQGSFYRRWVKRSIGLARDFLQMFRNPGGSGRIILYNQDLTDLVDIPSDSLDAVVSVSALEHNTKQGLEEAINEIMRVIKPGGKLLATVTATNREDWWHEPSHGWCLTEASIRQIFDMPPEVRSNYTKYDELFEGLSNCAELSENLASFYFKSDQNGMPWGKWDPKYQPVGICMIKRA